MLSAVILALGLLGAPLVAEAQQAGKVYRLGILSPAAPAPAPVRVVADLVPPALRELGYVEGRNLLVERRFAEGKPDRLPGLARELVQRRVDVLIAVGDAVPAAKDATQVIPIVMVVGSPRFVRNFARPEGNITGVVLAPGTLENKRLQLIKETVPRAARVALLTTGESHRRIGFPGTGQGGAGGRLVSRR